MNLAEIKRRLPMYVKHTCDDSVDSVKVCDSTVGILFGNHKIYFKAICYHSDIEYARRDRFLSFFTYTKLLTLDGFYRETLYELHGFKDDIT